MPIVLSVVACALEHKVAVTEIIWPTKPQIITLWPVTEKIWTPNVLHPALCIPTLD
jgi:hypothetical protein